MHKPVTYRFIMLFFMNIYPNKVKCFLVCGSLWVHSQKLPECQENKSPTIYLFQILTLIKLIWNFHTKNVMLFKRAEESVSWKSFIFMFCDIVRLYDRNTSVIRLSWLEDSVCALSATFVQLHIWFKTAGNKKWIAFLFINHKYIATQMTDCWLIYYSYVHRWEDIQFLQNPGMSPEMSAHNHANGKHATLICLKICCCFPTNKFNIWKYFAWHSLYNFKV